MPYQIRAAKDEDYAVICGFTNNEQEQFYFSPSSRFPLTIEHIREKMKQRLAPTVVVQDGHVIAFANFYDFKEGVRAFIGNVVVRKSMRRQGVASFLIMQMLHLGFSRYDFQSIHISCFSDNLGGLILYDKLGFTPYALECRKTRSGRDVVLIHLKIDKQGFITNKLGND